MPLYTLYPCRADGASDTFVTRELDDDTAASLQALDMLDLHPTATHVVVWCGDRKVHTRQRVHPDLTAVLGRLTP